MLGLHDKFQIYHYHSIYLKQGIGNIFGKSDGALLPEMGATHGGARG